MVQPFADNPLDEEAVSQTVYLHLINTATRYVYINTPYLVIDNETVVALTSAAKRGWMCASSPPTSRTSAPCSR